MVFSSILFLYYFLPLFLAAYFSVKKKYRNTTALIGSLFFYLWASPEFFLILLAAATVDHLIIRYGINTPDQKRRKRMLGLGIAANFMLLAYFKYANFFVSNANELLASLGFEIVQWTHVVLPIGISFFTFQKASFLIDTYRDNSSPRLSYKDYLLFVFFFPQLIAGPIIRFKEISSQIISREENFNKRLEGFNRFCFGLAKKVILADSFAVYADIAFKAQDPTPMVAWIGALSYAFQIYFDFSGYSDMAIGLGKMAGFTFPENFNFPYSSKSITEFWRRWHITLSTWMKDYLYIPLGGNRGSATRTYINLALVFLFSGFWHGAGWNFILWGAYHGAFLIFERLGLSRFLKAIGPVAQALTFLIVVLGWVLFRAESLTDAVTYYGELFTPGGKPAPEPNQRLIAMGLIGLGTLIFTPQTIREKVNTLFVFNTKAKLTVVSIASFLLLIYSTGEMAASGFSPFIYFRF